MQNQSNNNNVLVCCVLHNMHKQCSDGRNYTNKSIIDSHEIVHNPKLIKSNNINSTKIKSQ